MDRILIRGGRPLQGTIAIGGAKNAALPIMAACLLCEEPVRLENIPDLADVSSMRRLIQMLGASVTLPGGASGCMSLHTPTLAETTAPYDLVRKMRASVLVLGPLVARAGEARVSLPGGCAIGPRPVDLHLRGLELLGAEIELREGYIHARARDGLHGAEIPLGVPSVGATENLIMAASLARGETVISNAAREPEIVDLARFLVAMGARIEGAGSAIIRIEGVPRLGGGSHNILPDRIETGTYAMAAAVTRGRVVLAGVERAILASAAEKLEEAGVGLADVAEGLEVAGDRPHLIGTDVMTGPYPGFATDLQAQFMVLMTVAEGASMITETVFENRFMHVPELSRMGARITVHGGSALVRGVGRLTAAPVMATDLRASVSLVLAGLAAEGETEINRVYHLDRGYERLEHKLRACGADIERVA